MKRKKEIDLETARLDMVRYQIARRGIVDKRLLAALGRVPRHAYVPPAEQERAYQDGPLSIGSGQTISQPYIVAYMTNELALNGTERILEIGTGSGYQTAILAELAAEVFTVEVIDELGRTARDRLERAGYGNISFQIGDGRLGWPEEAPFDGIIVTAGAERRPVELPFQLRDGASMIIPVGGGIQNLERVTRRGETFKTKTLISVRFVPLV